MIVSFGNRLARDLVEERKSKETRLFPQQLHRVARQKLLMVHGAREVVDLRIPPGNRLERLKGERAGSYSIRVFNDQWRMVFRFENGNAHDVMVEDYHS